MANILRITEAASLALHTMVVLANNPGKQMPTKEIAALLHGSEFHLSKILQRLARAGIVMSVRGPKGGFKMRIAGDELTLLDVYEAIEGRLDPAVCLQGAPVCNNAQCFLGGLIESVNLQVRDYLAKTRICDLVELCRIGTAPRRR